MVKKLLLADDSQTIHRVLELTFAEEDFEIISAFNGTEAINKLNEVKPDLVIADVNMPEQDGYQVCQYIKNDPELSHIPVILLKGTFEPFDEAKANACHYDGIIAKPFQTKNIISTVKDILTSQQPSEGEETIEEKVEEEVSPEMFQPQAAPHIEPPIEITKEKEEVALEEEPTVAEEAAPPIEEEPPKVEEEEFKEAVEGVPELESLTEEEILGLTETSEDELLLEDISAEKEEDETTDVSLEPEAAIEKEAIPEEGIMEEPVTKDEGFIEEEPEETELAQVIVEEDLAEAAPPIVEGNEEVKEEIPSPEEEEPPLLKTEEPKATGFGELPYSEEVIERIANKVVEKLSSKAIEQIAWEIIPDMAESYIKKAINEIKKS